MTDRPVPPNQARPPWWPKQASWQGRPAAPWGRPAAPLAEPVPAVPPPPEAPPLLNRVVGLLLLAATLGLASCQAFISAVSTGTP